MDRTVLYLGILASLSSDMDDETAGEYVNYKYKLLRIDSIINLIQDAIVHDKGIPKEYWSGLYSKCEKLRDKITEKLEKLEE